MFRKLSPARNLFFNNYSYNGQRNFFQKCRIELTIVSNYKGTIEKHKISGLEGTNLLDAINEAGLENISIFGVCNKQLACHSCAVHVLSNYKNLEKPSENEIDVHCELGELYRPNCTRMSCQIFLNENMKGMEIEIPRSAFFFCNQDEDNK